MTEIVVIGGGAAGASAALALAEQGAAVNVIDTHRPGGSATGASAGMLAPQYESASPGDLFRLLLESRAVAPDFYRYVGELAGEAMDVRVEGMLVANFTEREHREARASMFWQCVAGGQAELLTPGDAVRLQPRISLAACSYSWLPREGQVDSQQLASLLPAALARAGVRVLAGRSATEVRVQGGRATGVVLEGGAYIPGDAVVLAAGAWSGTIAGVPYTAPVRPVRGHILRFAAGTVRLRSLVAGHAGKYLVGRTDGSILAGSTMDETGFDRSIDDGSLQAIREAAILLVPALATVPAVEHWADLRPISTDGLPIVGPDPELDGFFYATGYGRNGILFAPLAGKVLASMILGGVTPPEWRSLLPGRDRAAPGERAVPLGRAASVG
jgi:glycine oxidase